MNIEKIMTKNIIIGSITNTIDEISQTMKKYDIGFLPISDQKKIVGVITDRDIVINALSNKCDKGLIEKYITKNIISINKNKSLENALNLMGEKKVKRLIVTSDNKIVGIISFSDIINNYNDDKLLLNIIKKIWSINRNDDLFKTEIDEFYL